MQAAGTGDVAGAAKLLCFFLGGQEYGAPITEVKETLLVKPITPVFLTPPWLSGIINLRGDVLAVIDLAQFLGQPPTTLTGDCRIVVVLWRDGGDDARPRLAGILVNRMAELRTIDLGALQPPPATLAPRGAELLRGVATVEDGAPLRVLDLPALMTSERMRAFQSRA